MLLSNGQEIKNNIGEGEINYPLLFEYINSYTNSLYTEEIFIPFVLSKTLTLQKKQKIMAKGGGSTRTVSANNASASRTSSSTSAKYNAEYISAKTKEINSFKLPKQNDSEYIRIKDVEYRISHESTYDKRHIVNPLAELI